MTFAFVYVLVVLFVDQLVQCLGTINPTSVPIQNSIANRDQFSNYIFNMIPQTSIPAGGIVQIIFPDQYYSFLGIDQITNTTCSVYCTIVSRTVQFTLPQATPNNTVISVSINQVLNPDFKGGTGNFIVRTMNGQNIFDENLVFSTIGVADYIVPLNAALVQVDPLIGSTIVAANTYYNFILKTGVYLPIGTYFQISIPITQGYIIGNLSSCAIININQTLPLGNLTCTNPQGGVILITGLQQDLQEYDQLGVQINLINPPYAQQTNNFQIIAFRQNTTLAYTWRTQLIGVQIIPSSLNATISQVLSNGKLSLSKVNDFNISFNTTNTIPANGAINVVMATGFYMLYQSGYDKVLVMVGLQTTGLIINVSPQGFTITNFNQVQLLHNQIQVPGGTLIQVIFRCINKLTPGISNSFIVQSYYESQLIHIIDQMILGLTFNISNINREATFPVTQATMSQPYAGGVSSTFTIIITPTQLVPNNGYIHIIYPQSWSTTPVDPVLGMVSTIQLTSAQTSSLTYTTNVVTPPFGGSYLVDIETYQPDGVTLLQVSSVYVTLQPKQIAVASIQLIGNEHSAVGNNKYSLVIVKFTTNDFIVQGYQLPNTTQSIGVITLQFGPVLTWDNALGTNSINQSPFPCSVISGLQGSIVCTLILGTIYSVPYIQISGFASVNTSTAIEIHFPNILNPNALSVSLTINAGKLQVGALFITNAYTQVIGLSTPGLVTWSTYNEPFQFSKQIVSTQFQMTVVPGFSANVQSGAYILFTFPTYDIGFLTSNTSCLINGISQSCQLQFGVDQILIQTSSLITAASNPPPSFTFLNLQWPRTSTSKGYLNWIVFNGAPMIEVEKAYVYVFPVNAQLPAPLNAQFPPPSPNDFTIAQITQYQVGKGFTGQTFQFLFQVSNQIPQGSDLVLTFPTDFDLVNSQPQPICYWIGLVPNTNKTYINQTYTYTQLVTLNAVMVKNISGWPAAQNFTLSCQGIQTPYNPLTGTSSGWQIAIQLQGLLVNLRNNFASYNYGNLFVPGIIQIFNLQAFPLNQYQRAEYTIQFQLTNNLPANSTILVTFPSLNYPELPYPPMLATCVLSGAIYSFYSCLLQGSSFVIITDQVYTGGMVQFYVDNVLNPVMNTTDGFSVQTYYDGVLVDATDQSTLLNRTITFGGYPLPLNIILIDFEPQNQGLPGTYMFQFVLPVDLNQFNQLVITFPLAYDRRVGDNLLVYLQQTGGQNILTSYVVNTRHIFITQQQIPQGTNLLITIKNAMNPNIQANSNTGSFKIGIQDLFFNYIAYNNQSGVLETRNSPGWAYLKKITAQNNYARWISTIYTFNFTVWNQLPSVTKNGYLEIDWPNGFQITDKSVSCSALTPNYGNNLNCTFKNNILSVAGNPGDINGDLMIQVNQVENPLSPISVQGIVLKTYDGFKRIVIEKSYPNLDPVSFSYYFPGPLIQINGDAPITMMQGTVSQDLFFTVNYPSALNLTFGHGYSDNFTVIPKYITFNQTYLSRKFRILVPRSLKQGTYYIFWSTIGELNPGFYTPVKKTTLYVTSGLSAMIQVNAPDPIPVGGNSLNCSITLTNTPQEGIIINMNTTDSTFYLSTNQLTFGPSNNQLNYIIYQNATALQSLVSQNEKRVYFYITGPDAPYFQLSSPYVVVQFIAPFNLPSSFLAINVTSKNQISVNISLSVTTVCQVYWMLALNNTQTPLAQELIFQGPPLYLTTQSRYGIIQIDQSLSQILQIGKLNAQVSYVVFFLSEDRQGLYSTISQINFQTTNRFIAVQTVIQFYKSSMNQAEQTAAVSQLAFILSLPYNKVVQKQVYTTSNQSTPIIVPVSSAIIVQGNSTISSIITVPVNSTPSIPQNSTSTVNSTITPVNSTVSVPVNSTITVAVNSTSMNSNITMNQSVNLTTPQNSSIILNQYFNLTPNVTQSQNSTIITTQSMNHDQIFNQAPIQYFGTVVSNTTPITSLTIQIIGFDNSLNFPSPQAQIQLLNSYLWKLLLQNYLPTFAIEQTLTGANYSGSIPSLVSISVSKAYSYTCQITALTDTYGWIFVLAVDKNRNRTQQPTPYQVYIGLDNINVASPLTSFRIMNLTTSNFNITGLEPNHVYDIYAITGSDQPEYPDLQNYTKVLNCSTQPLLTRAPYIVLYGLILSQLVIVLILLAV